MTSRADTLQRKDYCEHKRSTIGCAACRFIDLVHEAEAAVWQHKKLEGEVNDLVARLDDQTLDLAQKKDIEAAKAAAMQQVADWEERLEPLMAAAEAESVVVNKVKDDNKPEQWAKKFQELADEMATEYDTILNLAYKDNLVNVVDADSSVQLDFEGLDRSKIPATPDCLIREGKGLELFLKLSRLMGSDGGPRLPTLTVGEHLSPAFMSHGRAISYFGIPLVLGQDPEFEHDKMQELSNKLEQASLAPPSANQETCAPRPMARTEREWREQGSDQSRTSTQTVEEQFANLGAKKFMMWTALLVDKYNNLAIAAKAAKASVKTTGKDKSKPTSSEGVSEVASGDGPSEDPKSQEVSTLPAVGQQDFDGFIDWLDASANAYDGSTFARKILPDWQKAVNQRNKTVATKLRTTLEQWDLNDESLGYTSPTRFNTNLPLGPRDLEKMGVKLQNPKPATGKALVKKP